MDIGKKETLSIRIIEEFANVIRGCSLETQAIGAAQSPQYRADLNFTVAHAFQ